MIWIIAILIGLIPAAIAKNKGYNFFLWWFFGASLFIVALPWAIIMKPNQTIVERENMKDIMQKCPECAEIVKREARVCRFCGYEFYPKPITQEQEIEKFKGNENCNQSDRNNKEKENI
ncbi:hypothetical protein ES705_30980 [subsurface metagenome]